MIAVHDLDFRYTQSEFLLTVPELVSCYRTLREEQPQRPRETLGMGLAGRQPHKTTRLRRIMIRPPVRALSLSIVRALAFWAAVHI